LSAGFAPQVVPRPDARCSPVTPLLMCGSSEQHLLPLKGALLGPLYTAPPPCPGCGSSTGRACRMTTGMLAFDRDLLVGGITWRAALRFLGGGGPSFLYPTGILYIFSGVFVKIYLVIYPQIFMNNGGSGVGVVPVLAALFPARRRRGDRRWEMDQRAMRVAQTRRHRSGSGTRI